MAIGIKWPVHYRLAFRLAKLMGYELVLTNLVNGRPGKYLILRRAD